MRDLIWYVFLNSIPVTSYHFAPGTTIAEGSYIRTQSCLMTEIHMNEKEDISIECVLSEDEGAYKYLPIIGNY